MDGGGVRPLQRLDIGDIVGVKGIVFRTQRGGDVHPGGGGDPAVKSLLPLPEKFHGLTNTELRYASDMWI